MSRNRKSTNRKSANKNSITKKPTTHNSQPASPQLPKPAKPRPNTKRTGERSEAAFLARALHLEFAIAKPWGDSQRYDFILDNGARLWRIQTKCTEGLRADAYETRATYTVGKKRAVYTRKDIDFLAVHVVPLDIWYIIPVEVCTPAPMLRMYPQRQAKKMRREKIPRSLVLTEAKRLPGRRANHHPSQRGRNRVWSGESVWRGHSCPRTFVPMDCHSDSASAPKVCHSDSAQSAGEEPAFPRESSGSKMTGTK